MNSMVRLKASAHTWIPAEPCLTITKPIPGSPAEKAGLMAGDQIIAVNGVDMTGVKPEDVRSKVIGPAGTTVHLTVHRPGQSTPLQFDIVRAQINVPSVSGKMLDNGIAYVQITDFGETTTDELKTHIDNFDGAKSERTRSLTCAITPVVIFKLQWKWFRNL